jgi:hypothetical protein
MQYPVLRQFQRPVSYARTVPGLPLAEVADKTSGQFNTSRRDLLGSRELTCVLLTRRFSCPEVSQV